MAAFAGKTEATDTINFPESFHKDTFIVVEWTIVEEKKTGRTSTLGLLPQIEVKTFTQDEIDEFIKQAENLEKLQKQLTVELDVATRLKAAVQEQMKKEHQNHLYIQGQLEQIGANEEKFKTQTKYVKDLMDLTASKTETAETELSQAKQAVQDEKNSLSENR